MTQRYDKDFKINAVKVYLSHSKSLAHIAKDLGISRASLGHWVKEYQSSRERSFPGSGHVVEEELRALRQKLFLVRQERDILKKAVAIFSELRGKGMPS